MNAETIDRTDRLLDEGQRAYLNDKLGTNYPEIATYHDLQTNRPIFVGLAGSRRIKLPV